MSDMHFNAFRCLNMPEDFNLCPVMLDRHYEASQCRVHPDQWSSDLAKQVAEKMSASCNQAYDILRIPQKRAEHLLQCGGHWPVPDFPDLFQVLLDWREQGDHPDALTFQQACQAFATAWSQQDIVSAQRAYWWMIVRSKR